MADYYQLAVEKRESIGNAANKTLRRNGKIPANYYYKKQDNINLILDSKDLYHALHSGHHVFEVKMNGDIQYVMIKEIQYHPVNESVLHVDLMRVRRDVKMTISVPIHLEGEAIGVSEGGVLSQILTSLDIECLPTDVPEFIPLNVSELEMNSSLSVADITISSNVSIITDEEQVVATIAPPKEEEEPEIEIEEGEEGEEGEEAVEGEEGAEAPAEGGEEKADDKGKAEENAE
ncbi:MAG TPA: 50S ribosomal protein L25 [Candidatus Marinimicrobia bacterium]|jgi:large subunit ribosomal protein L25|nr:50S ribosomal protein L25 [Candidatus Neomarinimicrobiota bacterium]HBN45547.1 50S ribosomal protein L25 [Candidatus Neomarinimicrobiota bacterium]HJL74436.1 50S ribosomal protein L25 [Candidatus Neomarinimicrobiota bacterium]HJM69296.1 50S ribosomal protein L25 [Candidatus Neomarinimicrobiota bacterium]|tara:strand:+ start:33084 stop:33782 length:699 start_codon:yes stop_codon:yes gene_type:complete